MNRVYTGQVMHARLAPARHVFRYPVLFFAFDLDELPRLNAVAGRLTGYNRRALFSLRDADHFDAGPGTIREKALRCLRDAGCADGVVRIDLVTTPRVLGHVFNPVSFYLCCRADGSVRAAIAEVNNTFGERHVYVLPDPVLRDGALRCRAEKAFHVSPFNDRRGEYAFAFPPALGDVDFRIDLIRDGAPVLRTAMTGRAEPLSARAVLRALRARPLAPWLTLLRIHVQAARLYWGRRLAFHPKPPPKSDATMTTKKPALIDRLCRAAVFRLLARISKGALRVRLPDGTEARFGDAAAGPAAELRVREWRMFRRVALAGDVGLGESFTAGEWDADDVVGLIRLFIANWQVVDSDARATRLGRLLERAGHLLRSNTIAGSRRNIAAHYDLSNDLFRTFLDETMMYSCGVYRDGAAGLGDAQHEKIRMLIEKADLRPTDHVLEIGCGWGAFAIAAARASGCRVTAVTISQQQYDLACARVRAAGLADRVDVRLCDYRKIEGQFDRIVSIEMIEAVGHEHLAGFFATCDRVLKSGGRVVIQAITIPHARYDAYRTSVDWIRTHIFPGGHLPSVEALRDAMARGSRLGVRAVEGIGLHYARTLRDWRERFDQARDRVAALGFDDAFRRKWDYYFALCEASFAAQALDTVHLVIEREGEALQPPA